MFILSRAQQRITASYIIILRLQMSLNAPSNSLSWQMGIPRSWGCTIIFPQTPKYSPVITLFPRNKSTTLPKLRNIHDVTLRDLRYEYYFLFSSSDVLTNGFSFEMNDPSSSFISEGCLAWKNACPMPSKSKLGAAQLMDEMGLFSIICQHGIVQCLIDMIQSGEL